MSKNGVTYINILKVGEDRYLVSLCKDGKIANPKEAATPHSVFSAAVHLSQFFGCRITIGGSDLIPGVSTP